MATKYSDLLDGSGAKFRADLTNSDRVTQAEWVALLNDAIDAVWNLCAAARPDFEVTSKDSTVSSGGSATIDISDGSSAPVFHSLIDVVFAPDTSNEYSLGPFAWQNRRSPGGWIAYGGLIPPVGGSRARLMGSKIYIEPSLQAGGSYRVWYVPAPKKVDYAARVATAAALPSHDSAAQVLSAFANGALTVDGVAVAAGDRVLVTQHGVENGIYDVTSPGSAGSTWTLTRSQDYNASGAEIHIGNVVSITEGTVNANKFFELTAFGSATYAGVLFTDAITYVEATVARVLEPFAELIKVKTALPAVHRDDDLDPKPLMVSEAALTVQLSTYLRQNRSANGPQKMVDTDLTGPRLWSGGW